MKVNIRNYRGKSIVNTQMICSGFRSHNADMRFTNLITKQLAEHFSGSGAMFEIIIYDNTILKHDETNESFATYKQICTTIRDYLLQTGVHPEAMEFGYLEWTFPKDRKYKDEKVKMAIHIKIHNHKVMRIGVVDKMIPDGNGSLIREKYPTIESLVDGLTSTAQQILVTTTMCERNLLEQELIDDKFKIVQAIALMEHANELIAGLSYNKVTEPVETTQQ